MRRHDETKRSCIAPLTISGGSPEGSDEDKAEKSASPPTATPTRSPGWFISTFGIATYMIRATCWIWMFLAESAALHKLHELDHKGVDIMNEACNSLVSNRHSSMESPSVIFKIYLLLKRILWTFSFCSCVFPLFFLGTFSLLWAVVVSLSLLLYRYYYNLIISVLIYAFKSIK